MNADFHHFHNVNIILRICFRIKLTLQLRTFHLSVAGLYNALNKYKKVLVIFSFCRSDVCNGLMKINTPKKLLLRALKENETTQE